MAYKLPLWKVDDWIMKHIIPAYKSSPECALGSTYLAHTFNIPAHTVVAALLDLEEKGHIELLETSEVGSGHNKTYRIKRVTEKGQFFYGNKSYRWDTYWKKVEHFSKNYVVWIALAVSILFNILQYFKSK